MCHTIDCRAGAGRMVLNITRSVYVIQGRGGHVVHCREAAHVIQGACYAIFCRHTVSTVS
jgi:hypothetical protein